MQCFIGKKDTNLKHLTIHLAIECEYAPIHTCKSGLDTHTINGRARTVGKASLSIRNRKKPLFLYNKGDSLSLTFIRLYV